MRYAALVVVASVLFGCGGGGGSGSGNQGGTTPTLQEVAQGILEGCALDTLDDYLAILEAFQGLIDPDAPRAPSFEVTSVDIIRISVGWEFDFDSDGNADLSGTIRFTDAAGNPTLPFDLTQLIGATLDDLPDLLASVSDGTIMILEYSGLRGLTVGGEITVEFARGLADALSGQGTVEVGTCTGSFGFDGADLLALTEERFPVVELDAALAARDGSLSGTITLDGTNVALVEATLNGGVEIFAFEVDLATGVVTTAASRR